MKETTHLLLSILLITLTLYAAPEDTIPPEILKQFDPEILSGKRPKISQLSQGDIFGLRDNPKFDADFVQLTFKTSQLSKVQRDIFEEWIKGGHCKILLRGRERSAYASILGVESPELRTRNYRFKLQINPRVIVTQDVEDVESAEDHHFDGLRYYWGISESGKPEMVSVVRYEENVAAMGMFIAHNTKVYFMPSNLIGPDADRLSLNFWHWSLGLKVPGAADTTVSGSKGAASSLAEQQKYDSISLRNGDTVSGIVSNQAISLKTSYGDVSFEIVKIDRILIEGSGANVDSMTLKAGDKLSGVIQENTIKVQLINDSEIELAKDKIQEIVFRAERKKGN